jgi:hypothetical protein
MFYYFILFLLALVFNSCSVIGKAFYATSHVSPFYKLCQPTTEKADFTFHFIYFTHGRNLLSFCETFPCSFLVSMGVSISNKGQLVLLISFTVPGDALAGHQLVSYFFCFFLSE